MTRTVTLVRLAAGPVAVPRPDGPLVRDLAAWVADPRLPGIERGPLPVYAGTIIPIAYLDEPYAGSDLEAALDEWVGRTVLLLDVDGPRSSPMVLLGLIFPVPG